MMEEALAVFEQKDALALNRSPDLVLEEARRAAVALTKIIESKPKKVQFNGVTYLTFEDWQTLGRFYGVTAVAASTKFVEFGEGDKKVSGFEARAEALLIATNQVRIASANPKEKSLSVRLTLGGVVPRNLVPVKRGLATF